MSTGQHSSSGLEASQHAVGATRQNADAVSGSDPNGFRAGKPKDEPLTTHGHKPGILASEADRAPEFSAQTLPAGSAPLDRTFKPNPTHEAPLTHSNADASSTIPGATSAAVHTGLGHPGQGQTSTELRHDGAHKSKKQSAGLEGVGARVEYKLDSLDPRQRGLGSEEGGANAGTRGNTGGLSAEDMVPESAEKVAAENDGPSRDQRA